MASRIGDDTALARIGRLLFIVLLCGCATNLQAAAPWQLFTIAKRIDADPKSTYPVTENNGPWMIMATTFRGDNSAEEARALVYELRSKYNLPAYSHTKAFDFSKPVAGRGLDPYGNPKRMRYQNGKVEKEVAVLVGDYNTVDDPAAQKALAKIKTLQPESIKASTDAETMSALQQVRQAMLPADSEKRIKGPMAHAFVATNPLLPPEYFNAKGVDRLVLEMNKDVPYSLLDCAGMYSICVATFKGTVLIDQKKIAEVQNGKSIPNQLIDAADKAHKLTTWLRTYKYNGQIWDAYEFHERDRSVVCVGSFNSIGTTLPDGSFQPDPRVQQIMTAFGNNHAVADPTSKTNGKVIDVNYPAGTPLAERKHPDLVLLDLVPTAIEVPRRSIGADYQRSMLSER
jgi:hypothetical protein